MVKFSKISLWMCANFLRMFLNLEKFTNFLVLYHKKCKKLAVYQSQLHQMTLWGQQVYFVCACNAYIWCACTSARKLAPQGLIPFTMFFNSTNWEYIYNNFEIWKQNMGKGMNFKFNKRLHWKILNRDNLELSIWPSCKCCDQIV